jgi:LemA protein
MTPWLAGIVIIAVLVWVIVVFNSLIRLRNAADSAWADIEVQLKRRYELVPNLVQTVKGYAAHEQQTLQNVITARTAALASHSPSEKSQTEPSLVSAIRSLFGLVEAYPDLKASEDFLKLQDNLVQIEDALQSARRYYNAVVRDLNTKLQVFPNNLVAPLFGVQSRDYFQLDSAAEARPAEVRFGA